MEQLQSQLNEALVERANLYDAMKVSDLKIASFRNAMAGIQLKEQDDKKNAAAAQAQPLESVE